MKRNGMYRIIVLAVIVLSSTAIMFSQRAPKILTVNGKNAGSAVVQINGRSYVDINALAQATNGSVTFQQDRIILTIPPVTEAESASPQASDKLSRDFSAAAISALAEIREWKDVVVTVMGFGVLLNGPWSQDYRERADAGMKLAAVAVSNDSDQKAMQLLQTEFNGVDQWSGTLISNRQALNATRSVAPNAIENDPSFAKITDCARQLNPMLASGNFRDVPSCH